MEKCPRCGKDLPIPIRARLTGMSILLTCPHCQARLEKRQQRATVMISVMAFFVLVILLGQTRTPATLFAIFALAIVILCLGIWNTLRPKLVLRKDRPGASVSLKL